MPQDSKAINLTSQSTSWISKIYKSLIFLSIYRLDRSRDTIKYIQQQLYKNWRSEFVRMWTRFHYTHPKTLKIIILPQIGHMSWELRIRASSVYCIAPTWDKHIPLKMKARVHQNMDEMHAVETFCLSQFPRRPSVFLHETYIVSTPLIVLTKNIVGTSPKAPLQWQVGPSRWDTSAVHTHGDHSHPLVG